MNSYLKSGLCLTILFVIFTLNISAQEFPVVFGKSDDGLPDKMKISGTITDLTFTSAGCGVIAFAGTLKVRLDKRIENYPYDDVYLMKACFGDFEKFGTKRRKYIGKKVNLEVSKLLEEYNYGEIKDIKKVPCAFDTILNDLNSNGIPFYCTRYNISTAINNFKIGSK